MVGGNRRPQRADLLGSYALRKRRGAGTDDGFESAHGAERQRSTFSGSQLQRTQDLSPLPGELAKNKSGRARRVRFDGGCAPSHIAGELFKMMTGIDMLHVSYRGDAPALTDLIGGQVQVYFGPIAASIEHIKAGGLRALAVTTVLPDIPTVGEFVPGYEASGWSGVGSPKSTLTEVIDKLNREINTALADPKFRAQLANLGGDVLALSPADFGKLIADETEKWGKLIRTLSIKAD